mgnify:CR=1 FL=1
MIQSYINHIVFVIDKSGSMQSLSQQVVKVFDNQISHLARRSKELDQETRVSVYLFSDHVECLIYDKDCLRLPSLASHYQVGGQTALVDGTMQAIQELEKTATLHGDHAFLVYALTDGQENYSRTRSTELAAKIKGLPENWTVAVFVPDQNGVHEAKKFGFPAENISVWNTSSATAVEDAGKVMQQSTEHFMTARAKGVRGTKNLFSLDTSKISATAVKSNLSELSPSDYMLLPISRKVAIKDFVESWTKETYRPGCAFYPLTKPEKIQASKQLAIQHKLTGKVYSGPNARTLLGLPNHEVKVEPANINDYHTYVQSLSTNRWLVPGTNLLVMK